jgi:hypothetical protein
VRCFLPFQLYQVKIVCKDFENVLEVNIPYFFRISAYPPITQNCGSLLLRYCPFFAAGDDLMH